MEKRMQNTLIMLKATLSLMKQNEALWLGSAPLVAAITKVRNLMQQIESAWKTTNQSGSGLVAVKENLQEKLIAATFELSSYLMALASQTNDAVLSDKTDFPISYLQNLRDDELVPACKTILTLATENSTALAAYDVSAATLEALEELIDEYEQNLPNRRVAVSGKKVANERIKALVAESKEIMAKQVDRSMIKFQTTNPNFYAAYLNARKTINYGTRHENPDNGNTPSPSIP